MENNLHSRPITPCSANISQQESNQCCEIFTGAVKDANYSADSTVSVSDGLITNKGLVQFQFALRLHVETLRG